MEFEKENVETEVYPTGQISIINFPYQQDFRYSLESDFSDKKVHMGSAEEFRLANEFLDYVSIQEAENITDFKLRDISEEEHDQLKALSPEERARRVRQVIRRRYPIQVKLLPGVFYSPKGKVVLDDFGKIKHIHQAEIDMTAIYSNYVIPNRTIRNPKDVAKEAMRLEEIEQVSQEIEEYEQPLPGPSTYTSGTPLARKRHLQLLDAPLRLSTGEKRVSLVGRRLDLEDELEGIKPGKLVFTMFDEDFMGFARDKKVTDVGPITPLVKSLTESVKRHENNHEMQVVNSVKVGEQFFGQGRCHIDMFKLNNFYCGHTVNFSLREATKLVEAIIRSYYRGSELTAEYHYKHDLAKVKHLEDEGESEDAALALEEAATNFNQRMKCILSAKRVFENARHE